MSELRGEWPGGIKTDPATGHLQYKATGLSSRPDYEVVRPVWACPLCQKKLKHSEAEHVLLVGRRP